MIENQIHNSLKEKIERMRDWLVEIRRTIHCYPELSFEEVETSKLVSNWLGRFGVEVKQGLAKTGVVGLLKGTKTGRTVAIRSDMDALPITESNQVAYVSKIKGKMHACGHDAHIAILLGVAKFFSMIQDKLKGNIKLIFQPAEETGMGGKMMVKEGVLENPKVDAIFGYHVFPFLPIGKIGVYMREGLAATDRFNIVIIGKGGHGAYPHISKDPILAASHLITQIYSIVGRNVNPFDSAVVSVGMVRGGTAFNIIPDEVEILGTIRSFNSEVRQKVKSKIEQMIHGIAFSFGMDYRFECDGHPAVINDPEMSKLVVAACSKGIGKENIEVLTPSMGGEDFAYYLEKCPGSFFRLGIQNEEKGIVNSIHSNLFDIDENVLPLGVEMIVRIVDEYLDLKIT